MKTLEARSLPRRNEKSEAYLEGMKTAHVIFWFCVLCPSEAYLEGMKTDKVLVLHGVVRESEAYLEGMKTCTMLLCAFTNYVRPKPTSKE